MSEIQDWQDAHTRAKELFKSRQYKGATFYFINSLAKSPGNMTIINDYFSAVFEITEENQNSEKNAEALDQLDWLESFLHEQVPYVPTNSIPDLLELASKVENKKTLISKTTDNDTDPIEENMIEEFKRFKNGTLAEDIPDSSFEIEKRIEDFANLREYAVSVDVEGTESEAINRIDQSIERLRLVLQFDALIAEMEGLINTYYELQSNPTDAAYCLQLCEASIRQLVVLKNQFPLDKDRHAKVDQLLDTLKSESVTIAEESQKEHSEETWSEFTERIAGDWLAVHDWANSHNKNSNKADRDCQRQIDNIKGIIQELNKAMIQLSCNETLKKASKRLMELNRLLEDATIEQHQKYNIWAMNNIQSAYMNCFGKGKEDIGKIMVAKLAQIDVRILTWEAHRCYMEVFDYFFNKLKGPKKEDAFNKKDNKLKVIKDMFGKGKKELTAF